MVEEKKQSMYVMNPTTKEEWEIYNDRFRKSTYDSLLRVFNFHNYKLTPPEATFIRSAIDSAIKLNQISKEGAARGEETGDTFQFGGEVLRRFFHDYHGLHGNTRTGKNQQEREQIVKEKFDFIKRERDRGIHNEQLFNETDRPEMDAYIENTKKK